MWVVERSFDGLAMPRSQYTNSYPVLVPVLVAYTPYRHWMYCTHTSCESLTHSTTTTVTLVPLVTFLSHSYWNKEKRKKQYRTGGSIMCKLNWSLFKALVYQIGPHGVRQRRNSNLTARSSASTNHNFCSVSFSATLQQRGRCQSCTNVSHGTKTKRGVDQWSCFEIADVPNRWPYQWTQCINCSRNSR